MESFFDINRIWLMFLDVFFYNYFRIIDIVRQEIYALSVNIKWVKLDEKENSNFR